MKDFINAATEFFRQTLRILLLGEQPNDDQEPSE